MFNNRHDDFIYIKLGNQIKIQYVYEDPILHFLFKRKEDQNNRIYCFGYKNSDGMYFLINAFLPPEVSIMNKCQS